MDYFLLGHKIRNLRRAQHMSQAHLAERIDVSTNYIGQIERGDRKPSLETVVALCKALNTNMNYLLSDSPQIQDDQLTQDILNKLNQLTYQEKLFFNNTLYNFLQTKE